MWGPPWTVPRVPTNQPIPMVPVPPRGSSATHQRGHPAGWERWASPARATLPTLLPSPQGVTLEGLGLPGGAGHPCPPSPYHLHQEPQLRHHFLLNMFLILGETEEQLLSGLHLPGSQHYSRSRSVRLGTQPLARQGRHIHHTGNGLDFPGDCSPSLRPRAAASSGWSLGG